MSNAPWHLRHIRQLIYAALVAAAVGIGITSVFDAPDAAQAWVAVRQYYGLWALGLLLAAMIVGPLCFVLPWLPIKAHLVLGRRAIGVSAFVLAVLHTITYLAPTIYRDWHGLFSPGTMWIAGLGIGLPMFAAMTTLAITSRDHAVTRLGPQRWKRWHSMVYAMLPLLLLHAAFLGADFGINRGPDVTRDPDEGALIGMLSVAAGWLLLFILRWRRVQWKWTPALLESKKA